MNREVCWTELARHYESMRQRHLKTMFANDPERFDKFFVKSSGIRLDYSKNCCSDTTMRLLFDYARACDLESRIAAMFRGEKINLTEERAALHTALRRRNDSPLLVDGEDVSAKVEQTQQKMRDFCHSVHSGKRCGHSGRGFRDILCLGIGGSFLGPKVVVEALKGYRQRRQNVHFVANVDGYHLHDTLSELDPQTTLVIIASKSFSTQETMLNAETTRQWLLDSGMSQQDLASHIVAISSNIEAATAFGIDGDNIFPMWDWVGGRYSLWSAIGLPIALAVGYEHFEQLLAGAADMDAHFQQSPLEENMPVILALMGLWNINFGGATSHCIIPYSHYLRVLPAHIQQLDMESNGKSVTMAGAPLDLQTAPAIWGSEGVNSQHAFFQQLHQTNGLYPVDFIVPLNVGHPLKQHHDMLVSHCFSQSQALMEGKTQEQAEAELLEAGYSVERSKELAPHKVMTGNKPSNTLLLDDISPRTVGALLALYEHKVVVQGFLWDINSFDQWGVELGKQLCKPVYEQLVKGASKGHFDSSTSALITQYVSAADTRRCGEQ